MYRFIQQHVRGFVVGAACVILLLTITVVTVIARGRGFSAREKPSSAETMIAGWSRSASMPAEAITKRNPISSSTDVLTEARAHWADHCAVCHANDGSGEMPMGQHMYPPAPDMRLAATQNKSDGELYYVIQNGVRFTGMPGWGQPGVEDESSWKLVHFIRHLPQLTLEEKKEMERLNPKGPDDRKEEDDEAKFLRGETTNEPQTQHHHH